MSAGGQRGVINQGVINQARTSRTSCGSIGCTGLIYHAPLTADNRRGNLDTIASVGSFI
jgi:hypothetical protein